VIDAPPREFLAMDELLEDAGIASAELRRITRQQSAVIELEALPTARPFRHMRRRTRSLRRRLGLRRQMLVEEGDELRAEPSTPASNVNCTSPTHQVLNIWGRCAMTDGMLDDEKIPITGATGKIGFPIARALAGRNDVWGAARLKAAADRDKLAAGEITPLALDMAAPDFSALPDDFSYVLHAAVDAGTDDWTRCVETNAHNSGELLHHCRTAKGFVFCSTGSIYAYQGRRPLRETDPPGVPLRPNYSFSKIAAESVCTWIAKRYRIPLTIIRICSTYLPEGGAPADRLDAILARKPIRLHPDKPNNLPPDLRRRLRRARHPGDGDRRHPTGGGELGGQ
jgi:hypothetical protein